VITGERQVRVGRRGFFRRDETQRLPKGLRRREIVCRQAQLREIATERDIRILARHGRVSARLEDRDLVPKGIGEGDLVEHLLARVTAREMDARRGEGGDTAGDPRPHESEHRRGTRALMHADIQPSVGEHSIGVCEGVGGARLTEAEALVELDRAAHLVHGDAELVEGAGER